MRRLRAAHAAIFLLVIFCALPAMAAPLCVNGHPAPRPTHLAYGGLAPRVGYERDHYIPLCLGGADAPANVRYQAYPEAYTKDEEEKRLCEAMCAGRMSLSAAVAQLKKDWPRGP
jgi:hypothetical protein